MLQDLQNFAKNIGWIFIFKRPTKDDESMKSLKWRFFVVVALTLGAVYASAPTFIYFGQPKEVRNDEATFLKAVPDYLPKSHVELGLDIQGGVQLVLGVETKGAVDTRLGRIAVEDHSLG